MPERFKNPPLVELVAELRWGGGTVLPGTGAGSFVMVPSGQYEELYLRFGSKVGALGYDRIERIVPPGFATPPFQATYRFRKKEPEEGTTIYQVGGGVFSANITPPYHSWDQFRPVVERGVECLLATRNTSEMQMPFAPAILRYIDAFGDKFTEGRSAASFIQDTLGFRIALPEALRSEMSPNTEVRPTFQLAIPLKSGQLMNLALADGLASGEQAVVMDLSVVQETSIPANKNDVMAV
jgi:uncharacterized protein (TIGR04255 family)